MTPAKSVSTISGFVFAILCSPLNAGTIDVSTGTASWTVSIPSAGVSNATPFGNGGGDGTHLCITSGCNDSGTWVTGGSYNTAFDGFWVADLTFTIPAGATGVALNFSNLQVDDRAVVYLNGAPFASLAQGGGGLGEMMFVDGVSDVPYTFAQNLTGTLTSGFNIGGTNTIEAIVNNTGCGRCNPPDGLSSGNPTDFAMVGTLSYSQGDTSTPEPGSMGLIAAGLALVAGLASRRRP